MIKHVTLFLAPWVMLLLLFLSGCSQKKHYYSNVGATKYTSAARHRATLKPYVIKNKRYIPTPVKKGTKQYGISSWYGPNFHGKYTSNGEIYNMYERTAAHKTFPMDTIVKVRNLENGKSTVVRINDRGPFVKGRIIDCSYKAGKEIGLDKCGIARVEVMVLGIAGSQKQQEYMQKMQKKVYTTAAYRRARDVVKYKKYTMPKVYKSSKLLGVQLGAYRQLNGAVACSRKYKNHYEGYRPMIKKVVDTDGVTLYRVWLVGFKNRDELRLFKEKQRSITERM
jgi:rare lipoprotein A